MDLSKSGGVTISKAHLRERKMGRSPSPWQKSALFAVSIVGAVCDRAFFLELTKCGRSQTAPTVGNPSLRLLPRSARPAGCAHRRERNQRRPHACHEEQKTLQSNR